MQFKHGVIIYNPSRVKLKTGGLTGEMSNNCVFCKIVKGDIKPHIIFEDEKTIAFLDAYPLAKGHTLIVPKIHVSKLEQLDEKIVEAFFRTIHKLIEPIQESVDAQATTIGINNGKESGQDIPHVHAHIIPRFEGDNGGSLHSIMRHRPRISQEKILEIARKIRILIVMD
jgi:histidine triad (HIT) family protein